jgi:hypothetical protein
MTLALSLLGNRSGQIGLAFLVGYFFAVYQIPRVDVKAIERNAISARDAYWQRQVDQIETKTEKAIADILSTVDGMTDASKDVAQYCERYPTICRSEK